MKKNLFLIISLTTVFCSQAQVTLENSYPNTTSNTIGVFQGITFREGGFSSLHYIPNTNGTEFWTITDRGVNVDAANANSGAANGPCIPTYDKIYGFPNYAPKIMRIKIVGNEVEILQSITIKRPDGTNATGLLNPTGFGSTAAEVCSTNVVTDCNDFSTNTAPKDIWGIDSEGLDIDSQGNFWICEEGGPTIWKVSPNGVVLKRYTPYSLTQPEDVSIDACFGFRRNNRGFEGLTITPNGKVYAIIQSPMYYGNVSGTAGVKTLGNSRIHRILEIDPATGIQKMYAYVNDGAIGTSSDIRPRDQKIGDLKAINNTTFLVIEQALRGVQNVKNLYTIDISSATEVVSGLAYAGNTKTLEELETTANLTANSIVPVTKTLNFDIHSKGWPTTIEKAEGIAIIDANTIVICNDNDYGQYSPTENGIATPNNQNCTLYKFNLTGVNALQNYIPNTSVVLADTNFTIDSNSINLYPNPFKNSINIDGIEENSSYEIFSVLGNKIKRGKLSSKSINLEELQAGIYILKVNSSSFKIVKE